MAPWVAQMLATIFFVLVFLILIFVLINQGINIWKNIKTPGICPHCNKPIFYHKVQKMIVKYIKKRKEKQEEKGGEE